MISENPLIQALDRMVGPIPDPDPVQVQGELHAYLIRRGQQVAQDLGMAIDLFTPEELAELGRLDVLGTMPEIPQDLALHLAMLQDQDQDQDQTRQAVASWHEQRERHRGHHHAANETCTVPALDQAQTAPEESVRSAPEESDFGVSTGSDHGQGDHAGRGQDGKRPDRDDENDRKRERYWHELTKDRPGEEWS
jgi:hypothetical protein